MDKRRDTHAKSRARRIAFLAFPDVVLLDLAGPWEVFAMANALAEGDSPPYSLALISGDDGETIRTGSGISLASGGTTQRLRGQIDTLVVPAADFDWAQKPKTRAMLRRLAGRSRRVASVCGGAFFLASAGLLDGRKATTHWLGAADLASRFPEVTVEVDSIFVKDGDMYTSAGATAGIDLALALVEEDLGKSVALNCARHLVVFMRRPGGQSQFSATLEAQLAERDSLKELIAWATDNLTSDLSVESLATRAHMSPRNFARVFRDEVGTTPGAYIEKLRVEAARRHLEETDESVDSVAERCGFGSADSMRRSFRRVIRVAPRDYRRRFRSRGTAGQ